MHIRMISVLVASLAAAALFASTAWTQEAGPVKYTWAGKKIEGAVWGIAQGDLDGDGTVETVLLERKRVRIGRLGQKGFEQEGECELPGNARGAKVYAADVDGDSTDDIIVSAVEDGIPASLALSYRGGSCKTIFERARLSLRLTETDEGERMLVGQGWSQSSFFFGPVRKIRMKKGRPAGEGKLKLPTGTRLYQFSFLPADDNTAVALLKGYSPLEVKELSGRKFKKVWRSPNRMGGSPNQLRAPQRDVLGSEASDSTTFDMPPLAARINGLPAVVSVQSAMPLKGVIGKKPAISGTRLLAFIEDPGLGFALGPQTVELPSCVSDFIFGSTKDGGYGEILVVMHNECGMFTDATESRIISFEIPGLSHWGKWGTSSADAREGSGAPLKAVSKKP